MTRCKLIVIGDDILLENGVACLKPLIQEAFDLYSNGFSVTEIRDYTLAKFDDLPIDADESFISLFIF